MMHPSGIPDLCITREQPIPFHPLSLKLHIALRFRTALGRKCVVRATRAMFRSAKPRFRLHKTARPREAARASGGRGWPFGISKSFFPRKAVGISLAAFL